MNSRKDITFVLGSLVLLILSILAWGSLYQGWFPGLAKPLVPKDQEGPKDVAELSENPQGTIYPNTPRIALKDGVKTWPSPQENDDGWDYDLFTTIDIAWDSLQGEYVPMSRKVIPTPPFGVALVKLAYPRYPYVLRSTMAAKSGKEEDREFTIENVETKTYYERCKLKRPIDPKLPIIPQSFKVEKGADGFPRNVLTLRDNLLNRTITIDDVKPIEFKDTVDIVLVSTSDPSTTWTFHEKGAKFTYQMADYVIKDIDLDNKTVTVDKTFIPVPKKGLKTFTQTLNLPSSTDTKSPSPPKDKAKKSR